MSNQTEYLTRKEKFVFVNTSFDLNIPEQKQLYERLNELSLNKREKKATMIRNMLEKFVTREERKLAK